MCLLIETTGKARSELRARLPGQAVVECWVHGELAGVFKAWC